VAKGYPDYYRGSLLFGMLDDVPTGINMDNAGNLIALLKAMNGVNPVTLACDADGNLKVSVEVNTAIGAVEPKDATTIFKVTPDGGAAIMKVAEQAPLTTIKVAPTDSNPTFKVTPDGGAAIMKVAEQSPLTSIQVEPKAGMDNLKIDINAQTVGAISTLPKIGTYSFSQVNAPITAGNHGTVFNLTGKLRIDRIEIMLSSTAKLVNEYLWWYVDGAGINLSGVENFRSNYLPNGMQWPLKCILMDDVNFKYGFICDVPFYVNTAFSAVLYANSLVTVYNNCMIIYTTL
jgi:hypothetical protein